VSNNHRLATAVLPLPSIARPFRLRFTDPASSTKIELAYTFADQRVEHAATAVMLGHSVVMAYAGEAL
jgi:hypothetical protein